MSTCPTCRDPECIYELVPDLGSGVRYFLDDVEVDEAAFVAAERSAGFFNTLGHPEKPATAGFSATGHPTGHVEYADPAS